MAKDSDAIESETHAPQKPKVKNQKPNAERPKDRKTENPTNQQQQSIFVSVSLLWRIDRRSDSSRPFLTLHVKSLKCKLISMNKFN